MTVHDRQEPGSDAGTDDLVLTRPFLPARGSGLDPFVEEGSWIAWRLTSASAGRTGSEAALLAAAGFVGRILESAWLPGRLGATTEIVADVVDGVPGLRISLAFAVFGPTGTTSGEAAAFAALVEQRLHDGGLPYGASRVAPGTVVDVAADQFAHSALITQRTVTVESPQPEGDVEVLSRFNPIAEPWFAVASALLTRASTTRVRATVMPTEVAVTDRLHLERELGRAHALLRAGDVRADLRYKAERAVQTLVDLGASFSTPTMCVELAVASPAPLPELFLRHIGSCFTSELDVVRQRGRAVVAGQSLMLGGYAIERQPEGLADAFRAGLPLRGGTGPRGLVDLITLAECPLGWPVPVDGPLPTVPPGAVRTLPAGAALRHGIAVGTGVGGARVHLPVAALHRHAFVSGSTGSGKSALLCACAVHDLREGMPFLFVDWHGVAARRVVAFADDLGVHVANVDAEDAGSTVLRLLPALGVDGADLADVEQAAGRITDAIVASLPDDWTGPRFRQIARALLTLVMVHGVEVRDGVEWLDDVDILRVKVAHPEVPLHCASVLLTLVTGGSEGRSARDWVVSKFEPFLTRATRVVVGRAGEGVAIAELVAAGTPIVLNLAGLTESDGKLVAHLVTSAVFDAAMARPSETRVPMRAYLDEAHKLVVASMQRIQTEGRKFGISLMLATQTSAQLDPVLADIAGSAAVQVAFRQTRSSAAALSPLLDLNARELVDLPTLQAYVKVSGEATCSVALDPYGDCPPLRVRTPVGHGSRGPVPAARTTAGR